MRVLSISEVGNLPDVPVVPRSLFSSLVDDAALFPPREAPVASAVAEHLMWRQTPKSDLIGSFLCPATLIADLCTALPVDDALTLSVVVDGDSAALAEALQVIAADPRLILVGVEASHERLGDEAVAVGAMVDQLPGVHGVLEVPREDFEESLAFVEPGLWNVAKYRTGGATAEAFPREAELAHFLSVCVQSGLPFKLTAGLHHAVRNYDARHGFQQHGVLNVLLATDAALAEEPVDVVAALLAQRDPQFLLARLKHWETERCAIVRTAFRSFGCCSLGEPLAELRSLDILQEWP